MIGSGRWAVLGLAMLLAACGGGGGGGSSSSGPSAPPQQSAAPTPPPPQQISAQEVVRFLTQATFGPTEADIEPLRNSTFDAWITQQIAAPLPVQTHQQYLEERLEAARQTNPQAQIGANQFYYSWWKQAATERGQLRQRMAFAYSQIFVVSLLDGGISGSNDAMRGSGAYYDMLTRNAFSSYRTLLEDVTLSPVMGRYLTYLANQREDAAGTRTPDENYAREVMQLMSIGLYELNIDGTIRTDANGNRIPAYTARDISELAKVFTGLSWWHPTPTNSTFFGGSRQADAFVRPMIFYPQYHSLGSKTFLGVTIPARTVATQETMREDLRTALDTIANHPNVGPFMATRLIQQFVTSNPSPAYVERVARVFNNNGQGARGDMGAVIRAVLTDPEARTMANAESPAFGKLREPVIRMTNWMRAFGATSASGNWLITSTSNNQSLGQSPLASPSVFNFWRPGFVPPSTTQLGSRSLRAPEMQIVDEVSVAGYVNTMQGAIANGIGVSTGGVPDVRASYAAELAVADDGAALVERMNRLLFYGQMPAVTRTRILEAVNSIAIPGATATQTQIDAARRSRVNTAVLLSMASPDYLVQR
jgi:uncharacterized protein (DUF1800 family)